jgi:hypothetical protein
MVRVTHVCLSSTLKRCMKMWIPIPPLIFAVLLAASVVIPLSHPRAQDIYPPLTNLKLRFENSGVPDPRASPLLGLISPWRVAQWAKSEALNPIDLRHHDDAPRDPVLGDPEASVVTSDGQSAVLIYRSSAGYVYELRSENGIRQPGGSSNLFLTASPITQEATFDKAIIYDVDAKLLEAVASYDKPNAWVNANVMAHVFTGFTLNMHGVAGSPNYDVFLQIGHSSTRVEPSGFFTCNVRKTGQSITIGFGANPLGMQWLDFTSDHGGLHHLHYVINDFLSDMLARVPHCRDSGRGETNIPFPEAAHILRNWKLGGIYLGLETHNRDVRSTAPEHDVQGRIAVAFQIANLHVRRVSEKRLEQR